MRNTNKNIKYLQALEDPMDPNNSTGADIASTVNGLIDLMGAMDDVVSTWPAVNPEVLTVTTHDPTYPYVTGSEVRLPYAFFRCINDVPAHSNIPVTDRDYWQIFYLPSALGSPYTGFYSTGRPYLSGHVSLRVTPEAIVLQRAIADIVANTPHDDANFAKLAEFNRTTDGWNGAFNPLSSYPANEVVLFEDRIWRSNEDVFPGPFNPDQWDIEFELDTTSIMLIKLFVQGTTQENELLYMETPNVDFVLRAGLPGSTVTALTAATLDATFDIYKNTDVVGQINFAVGQTTGTFVLDTEVSYTTTDSFAIRQRGQGDRQLADVAITIHGNV